MDDIPLAIAFLQSWTRDLQLDLLGRLALAGVLGGVIGLERELSGKAAGLRTNLLICAGAALFTELSIGMTNLGPAEFDPTVPIQADTSRIAAQIVSGVGFLGAGAIIQSRGSVRGLTTAATIWVVAAIGIAVGIRAYFMAVASTVLVGMTLVLLGKLEGMLEKNQASRSWEVTLDPVPELVGELEGVMESVGLKVRSSTVVKNDKVFEARFRLEGSNTAYQKLSSRILAHPGVRRTACHL